jgi:hypothetical protein
MANGNRPGLARETGDSTFGRHVINDQHADHDADQQRRQKKIFHFIDPFTLQEQFTQRKSPPGSFADRKQLTLDGRGPRNRVRTGTTILRSYRNGRARPGHLPIGDETVSKGANYSVAVTEVIGVPADWPASAGRLAQAEKPNAAAQATMRTIRI